MEFRVADEQELERSQLGIEDTIIKRIAAAANVWMVVACDEETIAGFMAFNLCLDAQTARLEYAYIDEEYRGNGYSGKMLLYAIERMAGMDVVRIEGYAREDLCDIDSFWYILEDWGFQRSGETGRILSYSLSDLTGSRLYKEALGNENYCKELYAVNGRDDMSREIVDSLREQNISCPGIDTDLRMSRYSMDMSKNSFRGSLMGEKYRDNRYFLSRFVCVDKRMSLRTFRRLLMGVTQAMENTLPANADIDIFCDDEEMIDLITRHIPVINKNVRAQRWVLNVNMQME